MRFWIMPKRSSSGIRIRSLRPSLADCTTVNIWWISFELQIVGVIMASMTGSAGKQPSVGDANSISKAKIMESIGRLSDWLEKNDYRGYDTFDGLSSKYLRPLTFETKFLRTVLQQGVRRFPLNLRPLMGIPTSRSTKGMAFIARGFMRL